MRVLPGEVIRFASQDGRTLEGRVQTVSDPRIVSEGLRIVKVATVYGTRYCYDGDVLPPRV